MRALTALLLLLLGLILPLAGVAAARYEDKPLPVGLGPTSESRIEPTFGAVASALADRPGEVRCWSRSDWGRINGEFVTHGDGTESLDHVSGFYHYEHRDLNRNVVEVLGREGERFRVRWTGTTDEDAPEPRIVIEATFEFSDERAQA